MRYEEVKVEEKDCPDFLPAGGYDFTRCDHWLSCKTGIQRMEAGKVCNGMEEEIEPGYCKTCAYGPTPCDRRPDAGAKAPFDSMVGEYIECRKWRAKE